MPRLSRTSEHLQQPCLPFIGIDCTWESDVRWISGSILGTTARLHMIPLIKHMAHDILCWVRQHFGQQIVVVVVVVV